MFQRGKMQPFFAVRSDKPRPISEATEIFDTEFEDESSEFEEDAQSPKFSFESVSLSSCFHLSPLTGPERQQKEPDDHLDIR